MTIANLRKKLAVIAVIPTAVALGTAENSQAASISKTESFSPVLQVDGSSSTTTLSVLPSDVAIGEVISDVDVILDFTKCDDPISAAGDCVGTGLSFNDEIVFQLISPSGTTVNLVDEDTYFGSTPGTRATVTFDDFAATTVGGGTPISGTFAPLGSLADFNGEDATGDWTLFFEDTVGADPLTLNSFSLEITTASAPVPEPASVLGLLGIGAVGATSLKRKKTARKTSLFN